MRKGLLFLDNSDPKRKTNSTLQTTDKNIKLQPERSYLLFN